MASTASDNFGSCSHQLSGGDSSGGDGVLEFTEFCGSSNEDKACAKLFWQSLTLHPPIESRLVSGDIRQRLPKAGPFLQEVNYAHAPPAHDPKLQAFLINAHKEMIHEESQKLTQLAMRRQETRFILYKRKTERAEKESILQRTSRSMAPEEDYGVMDEEVDVAMQELDKFDETLGKRSQKNFLV